MDSSQGNIIRHPSGTLMHRVICPSCATRRMVETAKMRGLGGGKRWILCLANGMWWRGGGLVWHNQRSVTG